MERRECNVCKKIESYENMILDVEEILECLEQTTKQWQSKNKDVNLLDWFCMPCCGKVIKEIEEQDNEY